MGVHEQGADGFFEKSSVPPLLKAALIYAAAGLSVFPLNPRTKKPATKRGFYDATTNPETIRRFWRVTDRNIGIATGAMSGIWILDIDQGRRRSPPLVQIYRTDAVQRWARRPADRCSRRPWVLRFTSSTKMAVGTNGSLILTLRWPLRRNGSSLLRVRSRR